MAQSIGLVALRLPPGQPMADGIERVWARGDAALPLPIDLPGPALDALLDEFAPRTVIETDGEQPWDPGAPPVAPGTAVVVATSGTTGRPKGVELGSAALRVSARASLDRLGAEPGDRWLCCLPLHHVAGVQVLVRSHLLGSPPVLHPRFDPAAVARADASLVALVPTMLARLLDAGVDLTRFRGILLGGAATPPGLVARARAAGARLVCSYGTTETSGGCVYDGVPFDGAEVAVGDDGRIAVRGPVLFSGYRRRPDLTAAVLRDGWFRTADLGEWVDGRLRVTGRADDVVVTGGENVDPGVVEALLATHPGVGDVAVAGRPDPEWGQRVVAYVVPADPARPPRLAALRRFVNDRASPAHGPRELVLVERLPRTALGKVQRSALPANGPATGDTG